MNFRPLYIFENWVLTNGAAGVILYQCVKGVTAWDTAEQAEYPLSPYGNWASKRSDFVWNSMDMGLYM